MCSSEIISLNFSVMNCQQDFSYQIKIEIFDISIENFIEFSTEKSKCENEYTNITFRNSIDINFYFNKNQKMKLHFYKYDLNNKRSETSKLSSLGSLICHKNSIYQKPFDRKIPHKEIFFVEINKQDGRNSEISVFDYLKAGIRTTGFIVFDFSENYQNSLYNYKEMFKEIINYLIYNKKEKEYFYTYGFGGKLKDAKYSDVLYKSIFNINTKEKDAPIIYNKIYNEFKQVVKNIISDKKSFLFLFNKKNIKKNM